MHADAVPITNLLDGECAGRARRTGDPMLGTNPAHHVSSKGLASGAHDAVASSATIWVQTRVNPDETRRPSEVIDAGGLASAFGRGLRAGDDFRHSSPGWWSGARGDR
jgi:hypothetical protein